MSKEDSKKLSYQEYLNKLNKSEITSVLEVFQLPYKKNLKKQIYIDQIIENLSKIVDKTFDIFQQDEYSNIKLLVKKKGKITIRINYLLQAFLENLKRNHLIIELSPKNYYMPNELLTIYRNKIKNKTPGIKAKINTKEYALILGHIEAYGVIDFSFFYKNYAKQYKLLEDQALERLKFLSAFYDDFHIFTDKKKTYIANKKLKSIRECNKILNQKGEYAIYTNEELMNIHDFTYMNQYKSYKKLIKFIKKNYNVEKRNFKIINNFVLNPFITSYQLNKEAGIKELSSLIDLYFEFNNQKHKNKFIDLIEKITVDYPAWELKGGTRK